MTFHMYLQKRVKAHDAPFVLTETC